MTVLPHTAAHTTTPRARMNRLVTLGVGLLAAVSGLAPAAYVLLAM